MKTCCRRIEADDVRHRARHCSNRERGAISPRSRESGWKVKKRISGLRRGWYEMTTITAGRVVRVVPSMLSCSQLATRCSWLGLRQHDTQNSYSKQHVVLSM